MALIKCPECQTEVSEKAANCPKCAYPLTGGATPPADGGKAPTAPLHLKKILLAGGFVVAISAVVFYFGYLRSRGGSPEGAPAQEALSTEGGKTQGTAKPEDGMAKETAIAAGGQQMTVSEKEEVEKATMEFEKSEREAPNDPQRTLARLGYLRSIMSMYYGHAEGKYPANLEDMVTAGFLKKIPVMNNGDHSPSSHVTNYSDFDLESAGMLQDTGGWGYVNNSKSKNAGSVFINCTHSTGGKYQVADWYKF